MRLIRDLGRRKMRSTMGFGGVVSTDDAARIAKVDGVAAVVPSVMLPMSDESSGVNMGRMPLIQGQVAGADGGACDRVVRMRDGRRQASGEAAGMVGSAG